MSKLDDIFKKGLDQKGLAYSDAHWAGMEGLLDKKKKGFFIRNKWYLLSLVMIGLMSYLFWPTRLLNEHSNELALAASTNTEKTSENSSLELALEQNKRDKNSKTEKPSNINNDSKSNTTKTNSYLIDNPKSSQFITPYRTNLTNTLNRPKSPNPKSTAPPISEIDDGRTVSLIKAEILHLKYREFYTFPYLSSPSLNKKSISISNPAYKWHLYLSPFVQMNCHSRKLQLNVESELKQQEKSIPTLGGGINLLAKKGHWVVKTGIQFNPIKERTNYTSTQNTQTYDTSFRIVILNFTQTPRGSNVALLQAKIDTLKGPSETVINNPDALVTFNYLTLPLAVQYELHHKRLLYFIEAGGALSILTNAKGLYTLKDASMTGELNNNSSAINKTLLQVSGAVGVKYSLTNHLNIWSSYGQNIGLNSMMADYSQKATIHQFTLGIEFGL